MYKIFFVLIFCASLSCFAAEDDEKADGQGWPKTKKEAVERILSVDRWGQYRLILVDRWGQYRLILDFYDTTVSIVTK
jgi:hypothetical protein